MTKFALAGLIFVLLFVQCVASAKCRDDAICVDPIETDNGFELHVRNLRELPITYSLKVDTDDYRVSGADTITRSLAAHETELGLTLLRDRKRRPAEFDYKFRWWPGHKDANHDDDSLYALPYAANKSYRILQGYGSRFSHTGREEFAVDFDMSVGTAVHAARSGVVAKIEESHTRGCWDDDCAAHANYIVIVHADGTTGEYYHLSKDGALVEVGEQVSTGQKIGLSGNTGHTTMPHLHFGVYRPIAWGNTQSIEVRFQSADGIIDRPRRGARHLAR